MLTAVFIPVDSVSSQSFHLHGDDPTACAATAESVRERERERDDAFVGARKSAWMHVYNMAGNMEGCVLVSVYVCV